MDRLHLVISVALICVIGCDERQAKSSEPKAKSRVNAVAAKAPAEAQAPADFCDVHHAGDGAPIFEYPPLADAAPGDATGWRWINLWATWCKPCIEEMPRLAAWEEELRDRGLADVVFVSADESDELVAKFRAEHPDVPDGPRLESPDVMNEWLAAIGLEGAASLPAHVFVDPAGRIRCLRMGGIDDHDRGAVERLLSGS